MDFTKMSRKDLMLYLEEERKKMLAVGIGEEEIYRIQFGEIDKARKRRRPKSGYIGDYYVWLDERRHTRPDHKYSPGVPVSFESLDPENNWISDESNDFFDVEVSLDLKTALESLTELQRKCFCLVRIRGFTQENAATILGVSRESVKQAISGAIKKLKKFSRSYTKS